MSGHGAFKLLCLLNPPESGHWTTSVRCLLCANSGQTVALGRVYAKGDNFRERAGVSGRQARVGVLLVSISRTLVTYA
jgi:hypothetical protein